jgi:hypothetical protein
VTGQRGADKTKKEPRINGQPSLSVVLTDTAGNQPDLLTTHSTSTSTYLIINSNGPFQLPADPETGDPPARRFPNPTDINPESNTTTHRQKRRKSKRSTRRAARTAAPPTGSLAPLTPGQLHFVSLFSTPTDSCQSFSIAQAIQASRSPATPDAPISLGKLRGQNPRPTQPPSRPSKRRVNFAQDAHS